jgi:hypothetical protein
MASDSIKTIIFNEKVSEIIRKYEKEQKREGILIDFKIKREDLVKI